ncbi:velvet factor-domain-containing protein [Lenzites betulinus]|nr:velvet factor-domain-containing protein [Lenzites betulinus]
MGSIEMGSPAPNTGTVSTINQRIIFSTGVFAGRTIRLELQEIQQAELGLKFTDAGTNKVPLDPPPVVLCRFFDILYNDAGFAYEQEADPANVALGAICHVDLFPDPTQIEQEPVPRTTGRLAQTAAAPRVPDSDDGVVGPAGPSHIAGQPLLQPDGDVVAWIGHTPVYEGSKCTALLVGATAVQAEVVNYAGAKTLVFVFSDLAVLLHGSFFLRFRVANVLMQPEGSASHCPILAECFGRSFAVHSAATFPGRRAPTALTKACPHLAQQGVRVDMHESNGHTARAPSPEEVLARFLGAPVVAASASARRTPSPEAGYVRTPWPSPRMVAHPLPEFDDAQDGESGDEDGERSDSHSE